LERPEKFIEFVELGREAAAMLPNSISDLKRILQG
jgi:hypothetical protein